MRDRPRVETRHSAQRRKKSFFVNRLRAMAPEKFVKAQFSNARDGKPRTRQGIDRRTRPPAYKALDGIPITDE